MTILPLQLTVVQLGFFTVQFCAVSLETWYEDALTMFISMWDFIWTLGNFNFFAITKTLILTVRRPLNYATLGEILKHAFDKS